MFKNLLARLFSAGKEGTNKEASKPDIKPTKKEVDKTDTGKLKGIVETGKLKGIDDLGACINPSTPEKEPRKRPILMVKVNKEVQEMKRPSSYLILEGNRGIVFYNRKERINKRRIWVYGKRIKIFKLSVDKYQLKVYNKCIN